LFAHLFITLKRKGDEAIGIKDEYYVSEEFETFKREIQRLDIYKEVEKEKE